MNDVLKVLDIKRERLKEWIARGYIIPSIKQPQGKGTRIIKKYNIEDIYRVALFKYLTKHIKRECAAKIIYNIANSSYPIYEIDDEICLLIRFKDKKFEINKKLRELWELKQTK